jgi:hypothetical protein
MRKPSYKLSDKKLNAILPNFTDKIPNIKLKIPQHNRINLTKTETQRAQIPLTVNKP